MTNTLAEHLRAIKSEKDINVPSYTFHNGHVLEGKNEIIIVEGIFTLCTPHITKHADIVFHLNAEDEICLDRYIKRSLNAEMESNKMTHTEATEVIKKGGTNKFSPVQRNL